MEKRILITDRAHPVLVEGLRKAGFSVDYHPELTYGAVCKMAAGYDGLIINSKVKCDRRFLAGNKHLEFIGRLGSGLDTIDRRAAGEFQIGVIHTPEGNAPAVAEHAIGMMLSLLNNLVCADRQVRLFEWSREPNRGTEMGGKTVGILGFGHTGSALAKRLHCWDVRLLTYDKYRKGIAKLFPYVKEVGLKTLLEKSDILSIHLPLTSETNGWLDRKFLMELKPGVLLVNTSRGPILNLDDLIPALESGHLRGAALDVLENESFGELTVRQRESLEKLFAFPNVLLSPHIAGWTFESLKKIAQTLLDKILKFYEW